MSFRQFPATGNDGNAYIILEFHAPHGGGEEPVPLRYDRMPHEGVVFPWPGKPSPT